MRPKHSSVLTTAGRNLGLESVVITPTADSPATIAADQSTESRLDGTQWHALLAIQDATITFEIDEISPTLLDRLETICNSATIAQSRARVFCVITGYSRRGALDFTLVDLRGKPRVAG